MKKIIAVSLGLLGQSLFATVLIPGDQNLSIGSTTVGALNLSGGPIATDSKTYSVAAGQQTLSGTLFSAVYRTTSGTLDFFYQIQQNPKPPAVPSDTASTQDLFAPITAEYSASAFYVGSGSLTGSPFLTPTIISGFQAGTQTLTGNRNDFAVDFHLKQLPLTTSPIKTVSAVFVLVTNATRYKVDTAQISGGTISGNPGTFSPTPEPGFYGALACGLGVLFSAYQRRKKLEEGKQTTEA